jgi:hypothetical protein
MHVIVYAVGPIDNWFGWTALAKVLTESRINQIDGPPSTRTLQRRLADA